MAQYSLIIDGKKVDTQDYFDVLNPATEALVAQCPVAKQEHLDQAVAAAQKAFKTWSKVDMATRKQKINEVADKIEAHFDELAALITQEQGKPIQGFAGLGSGFEVGGCVAWCRYTTTLDLPVAVLQDDDECRVELHRKPLGVVGSITPWNWPLMIGIWHVIPAIMTGNTVVIKPSSMTPLSTIRFVELANEVLPAGVLNIVTGEGGLGRLITSHPGIQKIVFTGSTPTGKGIMKSAADTLKKVTLELGGNDAGIVLPDVDVNAIAPKIFATSFINSGQTCAALKRLYVHDSIYDDMCAALTQFAENVKMGNGMDDGIDFGPVQNRAQLDIVRELADAARADGGRFLVGGKAMSGPGYFYPLTLVADVTDGCRLVDEEQFGPILPIIKYSDIDEVIERSNNNPNGLGGSVWSNDIDKAKAIAARMECGSVWINGHALVKPHVPFGGVKDSGLGVEFGQIGLEEYTNVQAVHIEKA